MNFNPLELLKNAQEIQKRLGESQERLGRISATGSAGGGMAEVSLNGKFEPLSVRISPELAVPDGSGKVDVKMIEDLVLIAMRDAGAKIQAEISREIGSMAGIPGMGM
jgi:DNA-binding YbaB/EbfC family protein